MKKLMMSLMTLIGFSGFAQDDAVLQNAVARLDKAAAVKEYEALEKEFAAMAASKKTAWLPYYYAALAQTWVGWNPATKDKDGNSAKINAYLAKAEAIEKNAELYAVENMSATQQMLVDPQSRWMTYGKTAGEALQKGLQADPNNPRLYYLQGMSLFGTPPQFGGGKDKAKPLFEKSVSLYKAAHPEALAPTWGQKQAEDMLAQCN